MEKPLPKQVAAILVCFGRRPGVIYAAVLEDTPEAPFLISLPILKCLGACVDLKNTVIRFLDFSESSEIVYNGRAQLCLKLFDFDRIVENTNPLSEWKARKVVGDECMIFHQSVVQESYDSHGVHNTGNAHFGENVGVSIEAPRPNIAEIPWPKLTVRTQASVAEAPVIKDSIVVSHGCHGNRSTCQEGMPSFNGEQSHSFVVDSDVDSSSLAGVTSCHDRLDNVNDGFVSNRTGNHDVNGWRHGGSCGDPRLCEQHDSRTQIQAQEPKVSSTSQGEKGEKGKEGTKSQQCGKFRDDTFPIKFTKQEEPSPDDGAQRSSKECGSFQVHSVEQIPVLLWTGSDSTCVPQGGTQLRQGVHAMSQDLWQDPVRVLHLDHRAEAGGVQQDGEPHTWCFLTGDSGRTTNLRGLVREQLREFRVQRGGVKRKRVWHWSHGKVAERGEPVRPSLESSWNKCTSRNEDMHQVWTSQGVPLQAQDAHADDRRSYQFSQEEEVNPESLQPSSSKLKSGDRKRILGEIKNRITELEANKEDNGIENLSHEQLSRVAHDVFNIRLIGEVFSAPRFSAKADEFGLSAGHAFDLQLGNQFLKRSERESCLKHLEEKKYGLVVVSPPCELFSQLQNLAKRYHDDPIKLQEWNQRWSEANVLLHFAIVVCLKVLQLGGTFLFEQPWGASSWRQPCVTRLLNHQDSILVRSDQCVFGQQDDNGQPIRKRTGFLTNSKSIAQVLRRTCK